MTTEANVCKNSLSESIAKDKSLVNLSEEMEASKDNNVQLESIAIKPQDSEKTEMETDDNNSKKNKPLSIRGIPIIAIVFPPLGLLMLLKYLLNKNKKEE